MFTNRLWRKACGSSSVCKDVSVTFIDQTLETLMGLIAHRECDWRKYLSPGQYLLYGVVHKGRLIPHYNSMLNQSASCAPLPSSANRLPMRTAWRDPYWLHVSETLPMRPSFHRWLNTACGGAGHKRFPTHEATSGCKITETSIHTGIKCSASPPAHTEIWSNFSWNFWCMSVKSIFWADPERNMEPSCSSPNQLACWVLDPKD